MTDSKPLDKWTVKELSQELKSRGLPDKGLKAELLQRLKEAMAASQPSQGEAGSAAPAAEQQQDAPPPQAAGDQQQQKEEQPQSEQPQQKEEQPQPEQPQQEEQQPQQEQMDTDAVKDQGAAAPAGAGEGEQGQQQQGGGAEEPQQAPAEPAAGGEGAKEEPQQPQDGQQQQQQQQQLTTPAKPAEPKPDLGPEEWETMDVPEYWRPLPLVRVRNIPPTATTEDVKVAIEAHGLTVKSVVFNPDEKQKDADTQVALVRFPPLPLPWKLTEEDLAAPLLPELQHPEPAAEKKEGEGAPEVKKEGEDVKKEGEEAKQEEVKKEGEEVKKEGTADVKMDGAAEEKKEGEGAAAQEKKEDKGAAGEAPKTAPAVEEEKKKEVLPAASPAKPIVVQPAKPLPDGRKEGDVFTFAHFVATRLMQRRLAVGEKAVALDAPMLDLTLFLGNLSEGMEDAKLQEEMAKYGELERCFVMRNKEGVSKGYGFAEFVVPAPCVKARKELEQQQRQAPVEGSRADSGRLLSPGILCV